MKILLIEDDASMQMALQRSLRRKGMEVVGCSDGTLALTQWNAALPDVVVLDLSLPGLDGLQVLALARKQGLRTPVLILTARGTVGDRIMGLNLGADDYLSKPFDAEELKLLVRNRIHEITKLRERFSKEVTLEPRKIAITSLDEKFLTKVMNVIETRMSDELFSIEELASEVK